jgi:AcrR family transcriptional regulator
MDGPTRLARTRQQIVQAAYRLFLDHGFHATSMRQVARHAGVALGGIYNHFTSKEDLFTAVLLTYHPYHDILPALAAAKGGSIEDLIRDAAARVTSTLRARPDFLNLMFVEIVEFRGRHMSSVLDEIFPQLVAILDRYQATPGGMRQIPAPVVLRAFLGLFFSFVITEMLLSRDLAARFPADTLDQLVDILLHGILAELPATVAAGGAE